MSEVMTAPPPEAAQADDEIPVLFVHQVERHYRQGDETLDILTGAELAIWAGQSVALVGPSATESATKLAKCAVDFLNPMVLEFAMLLLRTPSSASAAFMPVSEIRKDMPRSPQAWAYAGTSKFDARPRAAWAI